MKVILTLINFFFFFCRKLTSIFKLFFLALSRFVTCYKYTFLDLKLTLNQFVTYYK